MGRFFHHGVADGLDQTHHHNDEEEHGPHDIGQRLLMAVLDGEVAQASGADGAGDGGKVDQGDQGDGNSPGDAGGGLLQVDPPDDLPGGAAHGLGRLHKALGHLGQGPLDLPAQKGHRGKGQGDDGPFHADGGPHHQTAQPQKDHGQQDEGNGAENIADLVEHKIDRPVLQDTPGLGGEQKHPEGDADEHRQQAYDPHHLERLLAGLPELGSPRHHVGDDGTQQITHASTPPPSRFSHLSIRWPPPPCRR